MPNDDNKKLKTTDAPIYSLDRSSKYPLYPTTKKSEKHLQDTARDFSNWVDSEIKRKSAEEKISERTPSGTEPSEKKIRKVSLDEPNNSSNRNEIIDEMKQNLAMQTQVIAEASFSAKIPKKAIFQERKRINDELKQLESLKEEIVDSSQSPSKSVFVQMIKKNLIQEKVAYLLKNEPSLI